MKLVEINENGVAWVETDCGEYFGIVNAFKVLDIDGLEYPNSSVCDLLDCYTEINQDFDREANIIEFRESNGESYNLVITSDCVELEPLN